MQYDTIIIGAGSAGAILAARLSEDSGRSVLLLEAGPSVMALQPEDGGMRTLLLTAIRGGGGEVQCRERRGGTPEHYQRAAWTPSRIGTRGPRRCHDPICG